jgi:hypothetical protein
MYEPPFSGGEVRMALRATKAEGMRTLIDNFAGRVKETFQSKEKDGEPGLIGRTVEKGVEKGIASFEKKARAKLPDAVYLSGAGLLILLLLGALFYWARK